MGFQGVRIRPDVISLARDVLFALTTVAALSGLRLPVGHLPIFILFVMMVVAANFRSLLNVHKSARAFVLPLFIFMCIHLGSAFRLGLSNGVVFTLQALTVSLFVWAFVIRYSQVPMARYLRITGFGLGLLLIWVVGYHLAHHHWVSWKLLNDAKGVFDFLPVMLLIVSKSKDRRSRAILPFLLGVFTVLILLSGERKAYILLALSSVFLINFRSPGFYISILIIMAAVPAVMSLEKSGYVNRQINTLSGFASGKVEKTHSNVERSGAVKYAAILFKKHPIWGVGTNAYMRLAQQQFEQGANETHNDWSRVSAENGLLGLFFYVSTALYGFVGLLRRRVWGRTRSYNEMIVAVGLYATFIMYVSFEAYQFILLIAFCFLPFIQYLRLDPNEPGHQRLPSGEAAGVSRQRLRHSYADGGRATVRV